MARLEAQAKLLYYPTDLELVERLATWFRVEGETQLIDPCCGKGDALAHFAARFTPKPVTWGIELSYSRVEAAQHSLDIVHNASFYDMTPPGRWADRSVSLAFNNPPYDYSHLEELRFGGKRKVRHEVNFIERLQPKLVEGGQHVIIIPRGILGDPLLLGEDRKDRIARHLLGWFEQVMVFRAENQDWERFSQVVVLALVKRARYQAPGKEAVDALMAYADETVEIPILPEGDGSYLIPPTPKESKFQYKPVLPEDLVRIGKACSPIGGPEFRRITYVRPLGAPFQPATPLKLGHITMLISGQETGVLRLKDKLDQAMLVKGMSRKMADVEADEVANHDGKYTHTNVTQKERHVTTLAIVKEDGGTELLSDPGRVGGFITEYAGVIADAILQRNEPLYNWLPQESEMAALDGIAVGLPPLPGREERGLFLTQKHFVIGATRVMKKRRHAIINGEMGLGKFQPLDSRILTPTGWTTMGDIHLGDKVIGADGRAHQVVGVFPQGEKDIYRLTFTDGSSTECGDEHLWKVISPLRKWKGKDWRVLPLSEIRKSLMHANGNLQHFIPIVQPVEFEEGSIPLDPYFLGFLLGDGTTCGGKSIKVSTADAEVVEYMRQIMPDGVSIHRQSKFDYQISVSRQKHFNPIVQELRKLGLFGKCSGTIFVPEIYKFSSSTTRLAILQGLMDADGSIAASVNTSFEFSSISKQLAQDVIFLVQSLGGTATLAKRQTHFTYKGERRSGQISYRVHFRLPNGTIPFRLERKVSVYRHRTKYAEVTRAIEKVEYVGCKPAQCIKVDAPDQLYVTDDFIVTHNTSISVGALHSLDKFPALVMCPGHMVFKWQRDIQQASDPQSPITARIISRPDLDSYMLKNPGEAEIKEKRLLHLDGQIWLANALSWLFIRREIEQAGGRIIRTERRQVLQESVNDPGRRRFVEIACSAEARDAIHRVLLRQAFKDKDKTLYPKVSNQGDSITAEYVDRDEYTLADFYADYQAGLLGKKAVAIIAFDPAKYDAGWQTEPATLKKWRRVYEGADSGNLVQVHHCPVCGEPAPVVPRSGRVDYYCPDCSSALYNFTRWRRTGLARLVQKKYRHFFKVYIGDEAHKTKSGSTDLGTADQRFLSSIRYSLALTGTLFGGAAGSLFYLLYRRVPELRALYGFTEMNRWIDHYGLWEESWSQAERVETGVGASTGVKRWNYRRRELPGVSPAVIRFLLPITLFGNITDLGYELPPLYEDIVSVPMTTQQAAQYRDTSRALFGAALELARVGDAGALSVWFNTVRFRPASAFRSEQVNYSGKKGGEIHFELPAVITRGEPWLPKERKLAEIVRSNMDEGRKTLTFVEQTGTRDIRDRLRQALVNLVPGGRMTLVEVGSLSANSMAPAKREAWIKANAPSMDALLVNPRLIETGLDLLVFPDLVFYETTTSLYTMWQAMRRVWRLGQDREVHVRFLAYENTMEQVILERMGLKMKYAQLLYGESASGVLVEADGDDDIQREVIRDALQGKAFDSVGSAIRHVFGSGAERTTRVTTAPQGSVLAASPTITLVDLPSGDVMQLSLLPGFDAVRPTEMRRKRRKVVVLPAQLGMWE